MNIYWKCVGIMISTSYHVWFISGTATNMVVSLVNDVTPYCTERGSPVYTCYILLYRAMVSCLNMLHLTVQSEGLLFKHVTSYCTERGSPVYKCYSVLY